MTKQENFLKFFDKLVEDCKYPVTIPEDVQAFYDMLKTQPANERPLITDTGLNILTYLQNCDAKNLKAKDIADGIDVSSKVVSGGIRKLVSDGFVEKFGQNPVIYNLTDKGKNFDIKQYKESLNNEEKDD